MELFHCLYGLVSDHHQPLHKDYPRVQAQAQEHREEPEDQAEAAGPGVPGPGVGHVHQLCPQHHGRGAHGPIQLGPQALPQLRLLGPQ